MPPWRPGDRRRAALTSSSTCSSAGAAAAAAASDDDVPEQRRRIGMYHVVDASFVSSSEVYVLPLNINWLDRSVCTVGHCAQV